MSLRHRIVHAIVLLFACVVNYSTYVDSAVLGIDLGSENIKVVSVAPGSGFHIVLDEQTKRKWPALVAFDTDERLFGNNAVNLAVKRPQSSYLWMNRLLGQTIDTPIIAELQSYGYNYKFVNITERNSIGIEHINNDNTVTVYSIEELVAMELQHIIKLAEADAGKNQVVRDAVVSVPDWWTQKQRVALVDACQLANINVLSLINENTAAAVQYGIDKKYDSNDTTTRVVLYNMGATSTKVSLAEYSTYTVPNGRLKGKPAGQVEIKAQAFDTTLGGHAFENVITQWLVKQVTAKLQKSGDTTDITANPRTMAKLRAAAEKAKTVLSANTEYPIHLTSLINDLDFSFTLTRDEFYTNAQHLFDRVTQPLQSIIEETKIQLNDIDQIVIIGGSVRIPGVQSAIKQYTERDQLSQNLNGDEAVAFGSAFRAANLSASFQVRPFGMLDTITYPVGVRITSTDENKPFNKRAALFKHYNVLNKRKLVSFNHTSDLSALLFNDSPELLPPGQTPQLSTVDITGVSDLYTNPKYSKLFELGIDGNTDTVQQPKLSFSFLLDSSGITTLQKAEAELSEQVEVCTKKPKPIKPLFDKLNATANGTAASDGPDNTDSNAASDSDNTDSAINTDTASDSATTTDSADSTATDTTTAEPEKVCSLKLKTHTVPLKLTTSGAPNTIQPMTPTDFITGKQKLQQLQQRDQLKADIGAARNTLESYIYSTRSALHEEVVESVSTDEQRQSVRDALEHAEDWLYSKDNDNTVTGYKQKRKQLQELIQPIELRAAEVVARPQAIEKAKDTINNAKLFIEDIIANKTYITAEQREPLVTAIDELEQWLSSVIAEQNSKSSIDTPAFLSTDVTDRLRGIAKLVQTLSSIKRPKPVKPKDFDLKKFVENLEKNNKTGNNGTVENTDSDAPTTNESDQPTDTTNDSTNTDSTEEQTTEQSNTDTDTDKHDEL